MEEVVTTTEPTPKPREYTRKELGQLRRRYVTVVHGTVKACGHKAAFSKDKQPTNNCVECWSAFFMTEVDLEGLHVVLTKQGVRALVAQRGTKFVKMFRGFLNSRLMPMLNAQAKTEPVTIEGGVIGG